MSRRCNVGFRDACLILQAGNILCESLVIFVLCVTDNCSRTIIFTNVYVFLPDFLMW
jgi:hypothetical protein